jgi:hypothetical protein
MISVSTATLKTGFQRSVDIVSLCLYRGKLSLVVIDGNLLLPIQICFHMRQKEDGQFAQLLNRLRTHIKGQPLNQQDIDVLSSVSFNQTPESCRKVLHIFPTNKEVRKHNEEMLKAVCDTLVVSKAQDYFKNSTSGKLTLRDEPYSKCSSGDLQDLYCHPLNFMNCSSPA